MTSSRATSVGFVAILLWSLLAVLTVKTTPVPPLLLNGLCFSVGGLVGLIWIWRSGQDFDFLRQTPLKVWAMGVIGLFGYHFLYFTALRLAPPAQAGLIAYLWPLFIVLFSGLLPGESLRLGHIIGAVISFVGAAVLILGGDQGFDVRFLSGYLAAALCALTWSGYSVLSRTAADTPTGIVAFYCLATAALSFAAHPFFETTVWPQNTMGWGAVLLLGLGPVGLAFYVWDVGMKKGNIQILGVASYAAPLLSTLVLILFGIAKPAPSLLAAALLITLGALIAARASKS